MFPFFTGAAKDKNNPSAHSGDLINCYPEVVKAGGRTRHAIYSVLGEATFANLGTPLLREMAVVDGTLYAVANGTLFSVNAAGAVSTVGTVKDDEFTTITGNGSDVVVTANGEYCVWSGAISAKPTGYLSVVRSTAFHEYYTILTGDDDYFEWTALNDPTTRNALYFARNESRNDKTLRAMADGRELWFFGEESIEVWPGSGQASENAYLTRVRAIEQGLKSRRLICKPDTGFFFVGNDNVPYLTQGLNVVPVFHPGVVSDMEEGTADRCFYYEDRGHKFCVIRFTDRPAWVFDIAMGEWHRRSSGVTEGAWTTIATAFAYGKWYAAKNTGEIYEMARNATDVAGPLRRSMRTGPLYDSGTRHTLAMVELLGEYGTTGLGRDASVMMRISRDGGNTWSDAKVRTIGDIGEYGAIARWRRQGQFRQLALEFSITDPADVVFSSEGVLKIA